MNKNLTKNLTKNVKSIFQNAKHQVCSYFESAIKEKFPEISK